MVCLVMCIMVRKAGFRANPSFPTYQLGHLQQVINPNLSFPVQSGNKHQGCCAD